MLSLGWQEMALIFLAALVLFGPKKLPELGRTIGKAITEFRRATNEMKSTFDREMQTIERETEPLRATTQKYIDEIKGDAAEINNYTSPSDSYEHSSYYDSAYYDSEAYRSSEETPAIAGDSTTATHSTVGEPATQGAETASASASDSVVVPKAAEGTVARGSSSEPPSSKTAAAERA
jgi:sec-independent protein translocase protein TatA